MACVHVDLMVNIVDAKTKVVLVPNVTWPCRVYPEPCVCHHPVTMKKRVEQLAEMQFLHNFIETKSPEIYGLGRDGWEISPVHHRFVLPSPL